MAFFSAGVRSGISLCVALILAVTAGACGDSNGGDSGKVRVVTTLPLFADFVREIGGDRVEVTSLVPTGVDPHTFEPSPSDVKKVARADIAFANGLDLEPSAIKLIEANLREGAAVVLLANEALRQPRPLKGVAVGPHLWMDPDLASLYVRIINEKLRSLDPAGDESYRSNTLQYLDAIAAAQADAEEAITSVPAENRKLVTTHNAFGYYAASLGLEIVAVVAESPGQEPSPEDVANLGRAIEEQDVPAVFREPQIDSEGRVLEQAAKDAGVRICTLYSDSLDDRVTSYIEMMRFNADEIARCLGGDSGG